MQLEDYGPVRREDGGVGGVGGNLRDRRKKAGSTPGLPGSASPAKSVASLIAGLTGAGGAGGAGGVGGAGGTGAGGGTGGGTSTGGAPPIAPGYTGTAAVNPALAAQQEQWQAMLDEISGDFETRMAETGDPSAALARARDATGQSVKIASADMGRRGFGGGSGLGISKRADILASGARGEQQIGKEFEEGARSRQDALVQALTQARLGVGGGMAGTAGQIAGNQIAAQQLGQDAWRTLLQDATDRERIAATTASSQLAALAGLLGGLL